MVEVGVEPLRAAVEGQHGGRARFLEAVPVSEAFEGRPVWEGVVHVFDLEGHPTATPGLRLVLTDRGFRSPPLPRRATCTADQLGRRRGAGGDRGGPQGQANLASPLSDDRARRIVTAGGACWD
jgi:hypothetical protein